MFTIQKEELIPVIMEHYERQLQDCTRRIFEFQHKYGCRYEEFEKKIKNTRADDFEKQQDYTVWEASVTSAEELMQKLESIENGTFQIV